MKVTKEEIYTAGVYGLRVEDSEDYLYIGSGIRINESLGRHTYFLKRGLYADTNKAILQEKYDLGVLEFVVIKESEHKDMIKDMTVEQKESLQEVLSVLELFYINLYKKTICNSQTTVKKHSSNRDEFSTIKRRLANQGVLNPNHKFEEELVANILWLKLNGYTTKEIQAFYEDMSDINIQRFGVIRWTHLEAKKPSFIDEIEDKDVN